MKDTYLKSKKVLIVDDEESLRSMLITILEDENFFNIITADCVKSALEICQQEKPDIAILDVMLPDGNGFELMDALRSFTNIPVIFLTAKDDIQDKYSGFGLGADDYITKPFMPKELVFRLNAVLRRCYKEDSPLIELHDCKIDLANAQVIKNPITYHGIFIFPLCEAVWGDNPFGYGNSLLAHIRRIREKIELNPSKPKSLITVKGLGYKINVESRLQ